MHFRVKNTLKNNRNHTPKHHYKTQFKKHVKTAAQNLRFKLNFLVSPPS